MYLPMKWFALLFISVTCYAKGEYIELSHDLSEDSIMWPIPGTDSFKLTTISEGYKDGNNWFASFQFCSPEHAGTHVDAPYHFSVNGWKVDEIPLDRLIAPAVVMDISERAKTNHLAELKADDVVTWLEEHGPLPNNSIVLVRTGWSKRYYNRSSYFGHSGTDPSKFAFPGISVSAAQIFNGYRISNGIHIVGVGIDTPSLDYGASQNFPTHRELMTANIYGLENLKDLHKMPSRGAELIVMPMKLKGGSGAPARVIAKLSTNAGVETPLGRYLLVLCILSFVI